MSPYTHAITSNDPEYSYYTFKVERPSQPGQLDAIQTPVPSRTEQNVRLPGFQHHPIVEAMQETSASSNNAASVSYPDVVRTTQWQYPTSPAHFASNDCAQTNDVFRPYVPHNAGLVHACTSSRDTPRTDALANHWPAYATPNGTASCSSNHPTMLLAMADEANVAHDQQSFFGQEQSSADENSQSMNTLQQCVQSRLVDSYAYGQHDNYQAPPAIVMMPSGFMFNIPFDAAMALFATYSH